MIANTDTPEIDENGNLRRKFLGRLVTIGGLGSLGILMGKVMPKKAHAMVDGKYTNCMPNVKTSFNYQLGYPEVNPTALCTSIGLGYREHLSGQTGNGISMRLHKG